MKYGKVKVFKSIDEEKALLLAIEQNEKLNKNNTKCWDCLSRIDIYEFRVTKKYQNTDKYMYYYITTTEVEKYLTHLFTN